MVFCIEHSDAAEEICEVIAESLSILTTPLPKKIARLYLISDILHNCGVKITNASFYRRGYISINFVFTLWLFRDFLIKFFLFLFFSFESRLLGIFTEVYAAFRNVESRLKAEGFKVRVLQIFRAWEEWAVYPKDFLIRLQNTFLGLSAVVSIFSIFLKMDRYYNSDLSLSHITIKLIYRVNVTPPARLGS